jgi:hypothetical protein
LLILSVALLLLLSGRSLILLAIKYLPLLLMQDSPLIFLLLIPFVEIDVSLNDCTEVLNGILSADGHYLVLSCRSILLNVKLDYTALLVEEI